MGCICEANEEIQPQVEKKAGGKNIQSSTNAAGAAKIKEEDLNKPAKVHEDIKPPSAGFGKSFDAYQEFEASLPFACIMINDMNEMIDHAESACGGTGFVTMKSLREVLNSTAWNGLESADSDIGKILNSEYFKDAEKGTAEGQIDADLLRMFSLLVCQGKGDAKARAFYCILQEGSFDKLTEISAADKDFKPTFALMCKMSTRAIFQFAAMLNK